MGVDPKTSLAIVSVSVVCNLLGIRGIQAGCQVRVREFLAGGQDSFSSVHPRSLGRKVAKRGPKGPLFLLPGRCQALGARSRAPKTFGAMGCTSALESVW